MTSPTTGWHVIAVTAIAVGCGSESPEDIAVTRAALSVCEEEVPADRNVDGIPAYAQCDASRNSSIYSNNGVDTSTEMLGPDWVRTQRSGGYQCTELARRYLYFKWDIDWLPNGNAGTWCNSVPPAGSGMMQTDTPVHGDLMVLAPGSCGADPGTGHVVVVDIVGESGQLTVVEQNRARRGRYMESCAACFLHVVANTGEGGASGVGGVGGQGGTSGASAGTGGAGGEETPRGGVGGGLGGDGGSALPSGGAGGVGGVEGSAPSGGSGGIAGIGGAAGMMAWLPVAGTTAGTTAGTGGVGAPAPPVEAQSMTMATSMPASRDAAEAEACAVMHVGARSGSLPWSALGLGLAGLFVLRRRTTPRGRS